MSLEFHYFSPATPGHAAWDVDLGQAAVRLGEMPGLIHCAELGMVGIGSIPIDDPNGDVGHEGDAILGWKQFYVDELACAEPRIFTGYTAQRHYSRGRDSFRTGAARLIDVTLLDENAFLSFRKFQPESLDATSSFNRPAETDTERIAALLLVDFLSTTLFDDGFIEPAGVDMSANDYTRQTPASVLFDCAQQSGHNFFVRYNSDTAHYALHYRSNDSALDPASASISNVLDDLADPTVMYAFDDWDLGRDPHRLVAGALGDFRGGGVYRRDTDVGLDTAGIYGYRDMVVSMGDVADATIATARLDRYLRENASEDDLLHGSIWVPAAKVNDIKAGQWLSVKMSHLPGYGDWRECRVLRRDICQVQDTQAFYTVRLELCPMIPPVTIVQQMSFEIGDAGSASATWASGIPSAAGNLIVCVARKRNSGGNTIPEYLDLYSLSSGTSINFTSWGEAEIRLGDILGSDRAKIMYAYAVGDGRELTFVTTINKLQYTLYEIAGGTASGAEVLGPLSAQAGSGTKSVGSFSTAADTDLQIGGFLWDDGSTQTVGTGWTEDNQSDDPTTGGHPFTIAMHASSGPTAQISGDPHEWGGLAVNIPHA